MIKDSLIQMQPSSECKKKSEIESSTFLHDLRPRGSLKVRNVSAKQTTMVSLTQWSPHRRR